MNNSPLPGTSELWDLGARGWRQNERLISVWLADSTVQMLDAARVSTGMTVLDIASGAGGQTLEIARRVGSQGKVLATDLSPSMIELAAERMRTGGFAQVQCLVADAQSIDATIKLGIAGVDSGYGFDAGFDAATCRLGLMFCAEPLQALRSIRNCLRPSGRFGALVFSTPLANPCIRIMINTVHRHIGSTLPDPYLPGSLLSLGRPGLMADLMRQGGFVDIEVLALPAPFRLASSEDYVNFVQTSGAPIIDLLKVLDDHKRRLVWQDIGRDLAQFNSKQGWVGPNELLLCSGRVA